MCIVIPFIMLTIKLFNWLGYRLHAPDNTPPAVYEIMCKCWEYEPQKRPHFAEIHSSLNMIAGTTIMEDTLEM